MKVITWKSDIVLTHCQELKGEKKEVDRCHSASDQERVPVQLT